jgi:hypothetical protein
LIKPATHATSLNKIQTCVNHHTNMGYSQSLGPLVLLIDLTYLPALNTKERYKWHSGWPR